MSGAIKVRDPQYKIPLFIHSILLTFLLLSLSVHHSSPSHDQGAPAAAQRCTPLSWEGTVIEYAVAYVNNFPPPLLVLQ